MLANNQGPHRTDPEQRIAPDYGVSATLHQNELRLTITLRTGSHYCCLQPGCHLPLARNRRWTRLRTQLEKHGISPPARLQAQLTWVIEDGALTFDFSKPHATQHGYYEFTPVGGGRSESSEELHEGRPETDG